MMDLLDPRPQPVVPDAEYKRFLRYPPTRPLEGPMAENAEWARTWYAAHGRPWWCGRLIADFKATADGLRLGAEYFTSPVLAERARDATAAMVVAVSAGPEVDEEAARRWTAEEPDRYYFIQALGAAVVATLLEEARQQFTARFAGQAVEVKRGYAPGYPEWTIADMPRLLQLLQAGADLAGPLRVLESGMLVPQKSQLVVLLAERREATA